MQAKAPIPHAPATARATFPTRYAGGEGKAVSRDRGLYQLPRVMNHFNFSRWREKTIRRVSGEPDEGQGHGSRLPFC